MKNGPKDERKKKRDKGGEREREREKDTNGIAFARASPVAGPDAGRLLTPLFLSVFPRPSHVLFRRRRRRRR